eukprot:CAMPEP_0202460256 /NCGR_PEP_ID=MMETSP1360-20130828/42733_1 /ASSEMBLY_ACC=CAM_ASM_000848 /TAXON_ID=515479 /ORGANISM="Licmophora paradoxa, Strain CCMP2313" /LENGTH=149 /DNA_ID=CAMNT_0049081829 /DNA_START=105 /DNA_END=554 /DNA_ORIENTATION=+
MSSDPLVSLDEQLDLAENLLTSRGDEECAIEIPPRQQRASDIMPHYKDLNTRLPTDKEFKRIVMHQSQEAQARADRRFVKRHKCTVYTLGFIVWVAFTGVVFWKKAGPFFRFLSYLAAFIGIVPLAVKKYCERLDFWKPENEQNAVSSS